MSNPRAYQVGGNHYKQHSIQPWDIIEEYGLNFWEGNALKYLLRSKDDREEDLQKAIHYLEYQLDRVVKANHPAAVAEPDDLHPTYSPL
jgi:hypothetical protein